MATSVTTPRRASRPDAFIDPEPDQVREREVGGRANQDEDGGENHQPAIRTGQTGQEPPAAPAQQSGDARRELVDLLGRHPAPSICDFAHAVTSSARGSYC